MKNSILNKINSYIAERWQELAVATSFALAASIMIYTLVLQTIVTGIKISPLNLNFKDATYSPLTGVEVAPGLADRPVTGIMVENLLDAARPQSSLSQAGIVFEALAEGGITRYLALYQETRPQKIGPVRSLRPYYLDWAMGFDARIIHAGGSGQALGLVTQRKAKSINCLVFSSACFRTSDRAAPHNLFTAFSNIDAAGKQLGYTSSKYNSYKYDRRDKPSANPTNKVISIDYSSPSYAAQFRYDAQENRYLRFLAGAPDKDRESGRQITVKNVVIIRMPSRQSGQYVVMDTIGKGKVTVLRDGIAIEGTWSKDAPSGQLKLLRSDGSEISLNAGRSWFAIVPTDRPVSY